MTEDRSPQQPDDLADLLPDELLPDPPESSKGRAVPVRRTPAQVKAAEKRALEKQAEDDLRAQQDAAKAQAARLAQIVNLHIGGYSLADIGASIGATADEVDRMLAQDTQRYVRNQPALRTYVRNFISGKYTELLEAVWDEATDKTHSEKLENQDRALRILDRMARLHGAEAPVQSEMKIDAAPEAVERLVHALATAQGMGYDADVFDIPEDDIHEAVVESHLALEAASDAVEEEGPDDSL